MGDSRSEPVAYRRIRKEENTDSSSDDDNPEALEKHANMLKLKKRSERRGYLRRKVEAILWTSSMCGVLWYGDKDRNFFTMLLHNVHLNRDYLYIAYALLGVITLIFLYLSIYVTHVRKRNDWEAAEPWAIPTASLLGVVLTFMFMAALWPVYGLLTPVIQFVLFMGMLTSTNFIPSFSSADSADPLEGERLRSD